MVEHFEKIVLLYESSYAARKYRLTREEFIYLELIAQGKEYSEIQIYLNRKKSYLYNLKNQLLVKFKAKTLSQVAYFYGRIESLRAE